MVRGGRMESFEVRKTKLIAISAVLLVLGEEGEEESNEEGEKNGKA